MTGDRNPLHFDEGLARASRFGRIIVQGGVTSGLLNATVAEDLAGPGTVFLETAWKFPKAVGPGERITARVEVRTRRDDTPICTLGCKGRVAPRLRHLEPARPEQGPTAKRLADDPVRSAMTWAAAGLKTASGRIGKRSDGPFRRR